MIAVKAPALAEAAELGRADDRAETLILPMLNGVPWWFVGGEPLHRSTRKRHRRLPQSQVIGCVVHAACRRDGPAQVQCRTADKLILGDPRAAPASV